MSNQQLTEGLHKPIIRKFVKWKLHSFFVDNILGGDLADMHLASKFNKGFRFLLCVLILKVNMHLLPLKDKKGSTITNTFQKTLNQSNCKPNKVWVDKGSEFHNGSMKSWLQDNDIEIYSTHNESKSVVAERFTRTLRIKLINTWIQY